MSKEDIDLHGFVSCRHLQNPDEREYAVQILHSHVDDNSSENSSTQNTHVRVAGPTNKGHSAKLFEDALNSSDPDRLAEIFRAFMDPNCYMDAYRVESPGNLDSEESLEVRVVGLENLITYFGSYVIAIPDMIFLIHEWKAFERKNGESCVVFRYSSSGNQILPHDQRCHIKEVAKVPVASLAGRKRKIETTHSIKFKDTLRGHWTLSEQIRRQRIRTLGEFIADNRTLPEHRPEIRELQSEAIRDAASSRGIPLSHSATSVICSDNGTSDSRMQSTTSLGTATNLDDIDNDREDITIGSSGEESSIQEKNVPEWEGCVTNFPAFLLLPDAVTVNIRGVMRFHISDDGYVLRIHCSHFAKFNN